MHGAHFIVGSEGDQRMATWQDLETELELWRAAGERPTFWWRDDDTEAPTDALRRLISLSEKYDAPLHLAVIPARIDPGLAALLEAAPHVWSMQHGFAHKNHEPKGLRASEVGVSRDLALQEADLREGWRRMVAANLPRLTPIFVPPWNRIGDQVVPHLSAWGYAALSGFDRTDLRRHPCGLHQINGHIEPLRWRPDAQFAGEAKTLAQCVTPSARTAHRPGRQGRGDGPGDASSADARRGLGVLRCARRPSGPRQPRRMDRH